MENVTFRTAQVACLCPRVLLLSQIKFYVQKNPKEKKQQQAFIIHVV